jgi:hypothetical protein
MITIQSGPSGAVDLTEQCFLSINDSASSQAACAAIVPSAKPTNAAIQFQQRSSTYRPMIGEDQQES